MTEAYCDAQGRGCRSVALRDAMKNYGLLQTPSQRCSAQTFNPLNKWIEVQANTLLTNWRRRLP